MSMLKIVIIWILGFIFGFAFLLVLKNSSDPIVEVTIKNEASFLVNKFIIRDDKLGNSYLIENLEPNDSGKIKLFVKGEIGYKIISVFENGDSLFSSVYSERNNKDLIIVKNDSIIYKPKFQNY